MIFKLKEYNNYTTLKYTINRFSKKISKFLF